MWQKNNMIYLMCFGWDLMLSRANKTVGIDFSVTHQATNLYIIEEILEKIVHINIIHIYDFIIFLLIYALIIILH